MEHRAVLYPSRLVLADHPLWIGEYFRRRPDPHAQYAIVPRNATQHSMRVVLDHLARLAPCAPIIVVFPPDEEPHDLLRSVSAFIPPGRKITLAPLHPLVPGLADMPALAAPQLARLAAELGLREGSLSLEITSSEPPPSLGIPRPLPRPPLALPADLLARGIEPGTLCGPRFRGTWQRVGDGAAFLHRDHRGLHTGHELATRDGITYFTEGPGLWRSHALPGDTSLAIVETALDALACSQLSPGIAARFLSTGQVLDSSCAAELGAEVSALRPRMFVLAALPATPRGDEATAQLRRALRRAAPELRLERAAPPAGRSWIEALERHPLAQLDAPPKAQPGA